METNNMNIREQFEEIWPMPDGWRLVPLHPTMDMLDALMDWNKVGNVNAYNNILNAAPECLETFTRCQETTDVYVSLVEELVQELELAEEWVEKKKQGDRIDSLIDRAKQIMEQKK